MKLVMLDTRSLGNDVHLDIFNKFGEVDIYYSTEPHEVVDRIKDADIVIVNKVLLFENELSQAKKLKLICFSATGTNNVDLEYCKNHGIQARNVAGYSTISVAQHTFAMLFYLLESLSYYDKFVQSGEYTKSQYFTHFDRKFWEISGKTWGIIGLGNIGKEVARLATAFGCKVIYYSTSGRNNNSEYESVSLEYLLKNSDIVSIHAPLNEKTNNLLSTKELSLMKKTAYLLNVGRGKIVDENALAIALDDKEIAGAGLDVLEYEPLSFDSRLLNRDNLYITPHIAWASYEARTRLIQEIADNIQAYLENNDRNRIV